MTRKATQCTSSDLEVADDAPQTEPIVLGAIYAQGNKLWTCPQCDRRGVLAPGRMRKIDVRRYCLPCSEASGKLVERYCPSLERRREAARAALAAAIKSSTVQSEKAAAQRRARSQETRAIRAAKKALRRAVKLKAFAREGVVPHQRDLRIIDVGEGQTCGRAGKLGGFVKVGRRATALYVQQLVVHELCHVVLHRLDRKVKGAKGHGRGFQSLLLDACAEFFKLTGDDERAVLDHWKILKAERSERKKAGRYGRHRLDAYLLDEAIIEVVDKKRRGVLTS